MFEALKERLKEQEEGNVPWMYLDSLGYVTVGVGHLLATSEMAVLLPFRLGSGVAAGPEAIRKEYGAVRELEPGKPPGYYAAHTRLRLVQGAIDVLLEADVAAMHQRLGTLVPELAGFPAPAIDALLDMAFQLGPHGLVSKFPGLMDAVKAHDWTACAGFCHSTGTQETRN